MPNAAQLAADRLTLGQLESKIVPGGTSTLPFNNLAIYGFQNALTSYHPWGNSEYNGLALQMTKRAAKDFQIITAYTWSHNIDDSTATNFSTILSPRRAQDFQDMSDERADSALDRRQRFTLAAVYDLKPFQRHNWVLKNMIGNWNASGTYTFQSAEYVTIQSGVDSNLNGDPTGDRAIVNPAGAGNTGSGVVGLSAAGQTVVAGSADIVAYLATNPNARYITAGLGALANAGRNTFPLGRTNNIDAALMKRIGLSKNSRFEIGAQAFNLFNHPQFTGGYLSDVSPFSTAAVSRSFLTPGSPAFGQYNDFVSANSRMLQLVARIVF